MAISIRDIMKLPSLKKLKLIAGEKGLDKFIEWVYIAECFEDPLENIQWLKGSELIIITGRSIKDKPNLIEEIIKSISENKGKGLIVNVGKYIKEIPSEAKNLADELEVPLFELPWDVKLVEVSQEVCRAIVLSYVEENSVTHFLSNILFGDGALDKNVIEKAAYFGYDLSGDCYVCNIDIDNFREYIDDNKVQDSFKKNEIKNYCGKIIQDSLDNNHLKVPTIHKDDSVIILCKSDKINNKKLENALMEIKTLIKSHIKGMTVSIGIGNTYSKLSMMKNSLKESEWALDTIKLKGLKDEIIRYEDIGVYSLLFNINNKDILEQYYNSTLGGIIEYDKINASDLTGTLETYLDKNCNVTITAETLFIHRNTLKYRLRKIEELLHCDLHNFKDCSNLKIAFDSKKIIK
ncbi:MAG: PucR family transcriptional regulator ligand-binding domain-containing protein [Clostridium sp.]|nr:PucR family transcriptional regulator ligand-binding domain-containing protein [Clostridium sp.]